MRKIRYLILFIPVLIVMLFVQPKVHGFDHWNWKLEHGDVFTVVDIDHYTQTTYLGLIWPNQYDAIIYMLKGDYYNYYGDTMNEMEIGDYAFYHEGLGGFMKETPYLQENFVVDFVSSDSLSNGTTTIMVYSDYNDKYYIFNGEGVPLGVDSYRIDEFGRLSATEYDIGYADGYSNGYADGDSDGYNRGYDEGDSDGFDRGWSEGHYEGYWDGFYDALETEPLGFTSILTSIFSSFGTFFAIELLPNITIGAIILVPVVFGVIAFIIGRRKE